MIRQSTCSVANCGEKRVVATCGRTGKPTRAQIAIWGALVVIATLVSLCNYHSYQFGTHYDDSSYLVLARSLVSSNQYGMINVPGEPGPAQYPFGYPLLLVPPVVLFPDSFDALKALSLVAIIVNSVILFWAWRWLSRTKSYWWAIAIVGLYALSPLTIDLTRRVMSEPVFTTFCLLAIVLAEQMARGRPNRWWSTAMSVALLGAAFTRTIGVVLVPTIFVYLLLIKGRKFWKDITLILVQMAILLGIVVGTTPVQPRDLLPSVYLKDWSAHLLATSIVTASAIWSELDSSSQDSTARVPAAATDGLAARDRNIFVRGIERHFGQDLRMVALPIGGGDREQNLADRLGAPDLPFVFGMFVSGLVVLGLVRLIVQERISLFVLFTIPYFAVLLMWIWEDPRLLYPVQPQIHFGFLSALEGGIFWIGARLRQSKRLSRAPSVVFAFLVFILMILSGYKSLMIDDSRLHAGDIAARSTWFMDRSVLSSIIMTEAPATDYLYSGRKTVPYPASKSSSSQIEEYLLRNRVNYILVAPQIKWEDSYKPSYSAEATALLPAVIELSSEKRLTLVYSSDPGLIRVFQVDP